MTNLYFPSLFIPIHLCFPPSPSSSSPSLHCRFGWATSSYSDRCEAARLTPTTPPSAMPPPADIVKVAIEWPGAFPKLMEIDQVKQNTQSLANVFCVTPCRFKHSEQGTCCVWTKYYCTVIHCCVYIESRPNAWRGVRMSGGGGRMWSGRDTCLHCS